MRQDYSRQRLDESDVDVDPMVQFDRWFAEALATSGHEANAMTVATADAVGVPSARVVLLKQYDECGFVFFTHYLSEKGRDLTENPHVALLFYWPELERQIRITGMTEQIERADSIAYFHSRPFRSQLSALASYQSQPLKNRAELEERIADLECRFQNSEVTMPEDWGGIRVRPQTYEFWQGRESRIHDRIRYTLDDEAWRIERLSP